MQAPKKSFSSLSTLKNASSQKSDSPSIEEGSRFIPNRSAANFPSGFEKPSSEYTSLHCPSSGFSELVHQCLFGSSVAPAQNQFSSKPCTENKENLPNAPLFQYEPASYFSPRKLPKSPYKILEAPDLKDDFYVDLLDWSSQNILAVGLNRCAYMWNPLTSKTLKFTELTADSVSSVAWTGSGMHLAIGTQKGALKIFDIEKHTEILHKEGKWGRLGTLAWNNWILTAGSRDGVIIHSDLRAPDVVAEIYGHRQEICGLKWSPDATCLATGGNDNKIKLWSAYSELPVGVLSGHSAAVKALGWSPHQKGILASGGGTIDKTVRLWNVYEMQEIACVDSQSQVCNLVFSSNTQELVTSHGYSQNLVIIWDASRLTQVGVLKGHTKRVLFAGISPDGECLVTGAGDETLRFWRVFPREKEVPSVDGMSLSVNDIR